MLLTPELAGGKQAGYYTEVSLRVEPVHSFYAVSASARDEIALARSR
jgi:hypothetical protein